MYWIVSCIVIHIGSARYYIVPPLVSWYLDVSKLILMAIHLYDVLVKSYFCKVYSLDKEEDVQRNTLTLQFYPKIKAPWAKESFSGLR